MPCPACSALCRFRVHRPHGTERSRGCPGLVGRFSEKNVIEGARAAASHRGERLMDSQALRSVTISEMRIISLLYTDT